MKKLLFIGIVALMVQSLGAVTLPSTSYSPYAGGGSRESSEVVFSSGSMVKGSYSSLGDGSIDPYVCTTGEEGEPPEPYTECSKCCEALVSGPCEAEHGTNCDALQLECVRSCSGLSVPLDGGLSILLVLSLAGGAAKVLRNRRMHN